MFPAMTKLVRVKKTGKRYVFIAEQHGCVITYGQVSNPEASNPKYKTPGMKFLRNHVDILEQERNDELYKELYDQEL